MFTKLEDHVWDQIAAEAGRARGSAVLVYAAYRRAGGASGVCWWTEAEIAELAGVSVRTVERVRPLLVRAGVIAVERERKSPHKCRVAILAIRQRDRAGTPAIRQRDRARSVNESEPLRAVDTRTLDTRVIDPDLYEDEDGDEEAATLPAPRRPVQLPLAGAEDRDWSGRRARRGEPEAEPGERYTRGRYGQYV